MAIRILSAQKYGAKLKATVQASGKLGFTAKTAQELSLKDSKSIRLAQDEDDNVLYLCVLQSQESDSFKLLCSSGYYSINTCRLFKDMGMDYKNNLIIFDLSREPSLDEVIGGKAYKMSKREKPRKNM